MDQENWRYCIGGRLGGQDVPVHQRYFFNAHVSEQLEIIPYTACKSAYFSGSIFVWSEEGYDRISEFFEKMKELNPNDEQIITLFSIAHDLKTVQIASEKTTAEIEDQLVEMFWTAGDVNRDGIVYSEDLTRYGLSFGYFSGEPEYDVDCDFNEDGLVDARDGTRIGAFFGYRREYPAP